MFTAFVRTAELCFDCRAARVSTRYAVPPVKNRSTCVYSAEKNAEDRSLLRFFILQSLVKRDIRALRSVFAFEGYGDTKFADLRRKG